MTANDERGQTGPGAARSAEQLELDGRVARRQHGALLNGRATRAFEERVTELIRRRRGDPDGRVEQFDVVRGPSSLSSRGPGGGTPIVSGALLIRATLEGDAPDLFAHLVSEVGQPQARLDGRLLVLQGNGASPETLVDLARLTRRRGFEASVDHIVPLGPLTKAEGGPARTLMGRAVLSPNPQAGAVTLAVIDTGVPAKGHEHVWHTALADADNIDALDAFPLPGGDGMLDAAAGHGAFATGIVQQVDFAGDVRVLRAMDSDGIGSEVVVAETLLRAVREHRAEIVNLSLGAQTVDDQPLLALQVAFELLSEGGYDDVLLVAAAGNYGDKRPCWPAAFRRVVAVGALTAELQPAAWSSHGFWVDVSVVGEGLVSTYVRGKESPQLSPASAGPPDDWPLSDDSPWAVWSGTSFAAPQVAGEVARRLTNARSSGDTTATPRSVYVSLLAEGRRLPDYGVALRILDGTSVTT